MGTRPTPERDVAGFSVELDESSYSSKPSIFSLSGGSSLSLCLAGLSSLPAPSGRTAKKRRAAVITRLAINHLVTVIRESFSRLQNPAVCSKVLDLLSPRASLVAMPAEAAAVTREGKTVPAVSSTTRRSISAEPTFLACPGRAPQLSNVASRQQFLLGLLEDCSFFAHLVLRCVRAARTSSHSYVSQESAKPGLNSRSTTPRQRKAQPLPNALRQRSRQQPSGLEAGPPSPQTLWIDVACRYVQTSHCPEGML